MSSLSPPATIIVIDSNIAIWTVLPTLRSIDPSPHLTRWYQAEVQLVAPAHWLAECISVVRINVQRRQLTMAQGRAALEDIFALQVQILPITEAIGRSAFDWAERLNQARAYDALYLALAESLPAELWTADRRLVDRARQIGVTWVRWSGEGGAV